MDQMPPDDMDDEVCKMLIITLKRGRSSIMSKTTHLCHYCCTPLSLLVVKMQQRAKHAVLLLYYLRSCRACEHIKTATLQHAMQEPVVVSFSSLRVSFCYALRLWHRGWHHHHHHHHHHHRAAHQH
eukprot:2271439-Amphidinium_carterae.1